MTLPLIGFYCASKWAFEALHESLAQEVKPFGIRVTLIEPGAYATDFGSPASLKIAPGLEPYTGLREQVMSRLRSSIRGDLQATAEAVLQIVDAEEPPLRFMLGNTGLSMVRAAYAARMATWKAWEADSNAAQGEPTRKQEDLMSTLTNQAKCIPVGVPTPVVSVSPVTLAVPGRAVELQMRVSAPTTGRELPIILLSHGHGRSNHLSSLNGYGPLANFWAAHGFVVIQPTHLSSKSLRLHPNTPGAPLFWRSRVEDMKRILDGLDVIETSVPILNGRLDRTRVAVAGHSMGGHTASVLLGARLIDPEDGSEVNLIEPRIKAGVLLAAPGNGGVDLTPFVAEHYPFFVRPSFAEMTTSTLVVAGDQDASPQLTLRGASWHADPFILSPGPKCLLTLFGAEHGLGGVSGYDAAETTDENPERVSSPAAHFGVSPYRAVPRGPRLERRLCQFGEQPSILRARRMQIEPLKSL